MADIQKFESIVRYLKGEIDYDQLGSNLLEEKSIDLFNQNNYEKLIKEELKCMKDSDFYQYLEDNNCLIEAMKELGLGDYLNIINAHSDEADKERKNLMEVITSLPDSIKLKILNYTEDHEGDYYDEIILFNPITSRMDEEVLKSIIMSLSEKERIRFLLDKNNATLYFSRIKSNDYIIEIFDSLSEENKLRIFKEFTTITYEDEVLSRFIPLLYGREEISVKLVRDYLSNNSKIEVLRNSQNKYDYLLTILEQTRPMGRMGFDLSDIISDFDADSKLQILTNSKNEYDYLLNIISKAQIEKIIRSINVINDAVIDILNKYILHENDISKLEFFANNLKKLGNINEDVLSTCEFRLLTEEYKDLNTKLDVITCDSEIQNKILNLNVDQYKVLTEVLHIIESDSIKDWIPVLDTLLDGLNNNKYEELLESIRNVELTDETTIRKLTYILSSSENIFDIKNIEEVKKFDRIEYVEKIRKGELITEYTSSLNEIELLQLCVLEKKYGQTLEESRRLLTRYGKDLDKFEINDERDLKIKSYLESIRNILNTSDKKLLEELYASKENLQENYLFNNIIESKIREYFARQRNRSLYKLENDKKIIIDIPSAENIELYDSGETFFIELSSLGAYSSYDSEANFENEWNRKQIISHGLCTSFIANNSIANPKIRNVVLGFNDFSENSLLLSAPWDIDSTESNKKMNTSKFQDNILYCIPKNLVDNTRHTHNETVRERRSLEQGKIYKKQPSYVVYIPEISLEKYLELQQQGKLDDRDERNKLLLDYIQNDKIWQNSVRASKEFAIETEDGEIKPLPIVVVDRTYIAIKEKEKLDNLERELSQTGNPDIINRIIVDSENNRTGSTYCDEIRDELFSPQILQDRIKRIEAIIHELETKDKKLANECKQMLIRTTIEEEQKYACFGLDEIRTESGYNHNEYINRWIEEYNKPEDRKQFIKNCLGEKGKQEITKIANEIEEMTEYPSEGIHSKKHIQNVALFSYMIAKSEGKLEEENINLLLQASKFHDSGRSERFHGGKRKDGKDEHAMYSTIVATEYLQKQGMEENKISMINTAILYHEYLEENRNEFDENAFHHMCLKFGVKEEDIECTRLMCQYLKDADALDRTRFQGKGSLQARYLRTDTAKSLIGEAKRINSRYIEINNQDKNKSIIHFIDEYELEENNNMVSEKDRREATQVFNQMNCQHFFVQFL